jgi:DNA polymerase III epsilon subunit-like protein
MRILITGSRYFTEAATIRNSLLNAAAGHDPATVTVVEGGARGADILSGEAAVGLGFAVEVHEAVWRPGGIYNPQAGIRRNNLMVSLGADICLAFKEVGQKNIGTSHCANAATAAGIPVIEHWSAGPKQSGPQVLLPENLSFVTIDFETANTDKASIIQVGITKVIDGHVTATHTKPVLPDARYRNFSWANTRIHGLNPGYIVGAEKWPLRLEKIAAFIGDLPLVAHNVSVERGCILRASEVAGIEVPELTLLCSLKLARRRLPDFPKHGLSYLAEEFGYTDFQHHDAGEDARITALAVIEIARRSGVTSTAELFADQVGPEYKPLNPKAAS